MRGIQSHFEFQTPKIESQIKKAKKRAKLEKQKIKHKKADLVFGV